MSIAGFGSGNDQKEKHTDSNSHENYKHVIKLFGVPLYVSTKTHSVVSKVKEEN